MERAPVTYKFDQKPHVLIVQAPYHADVSEMLLKSAIAELERSDATYEVVDVPGSLEIPAAIHYAVKALNFDTTRRRYDGFIALGCIIKGGTMHDQVVANESARGLMEMSIHFSLAIGNGILTCNTHEQALERAARDKFDRGGAAAEACLRMIELKSHFRLSGKRRWIAKKD